MGMFDAKERAEAVVLAVEPPGAFSETDMHGTEWEHRKYILEVRPAGQPSFRVEAKAKVAVFPVPENAMSSRLALTLRTIRPKSTLKAIRATTRNSFASPGRSMRQFARKRC
jgi:hypothetical protein